MTIRIDGNALEQRHAQFLVLHLMRLSRASNGDTSVVTAAGDILQQLLATYPEIARSTDPFDGIVVRGNTD